MIRVAIVEDSSETLRQLQGMVERYGRENGREFQFKCFSNGVDFISDYVPQYDIIFMDIDMPLLNGLETSRILRKLDCDVTLVFVTNLERYAIHGYDVGAVGFIVKPLNYATFANRMNRFLRHVAEGVEPFLLVNSKDGMAKVPLSDIYYITVAERYVLLHTRNGEIECHKSMKALEQELQVHAFVRCDNSAMVNLRYVTGIQGNSAQVAGTTVTCSRNGRKTLLDAFTLYLK